MKKINLKAFTLVELLAVIIILGIIALITTPIVFKSIQDSEKTTAEVSAKQYLRAIEQEIYRKKLNSNSNPTKCEVNSEGNLDCDTETLVLEYSGTKPTCGVIMISNGNVKSIRGLQLDGYAVTIKDGVTTVKESKNCSLNSFKDSKLKGSDPNLYNNTLTPVIYDGNNWVIADASEKWYDYDKQWWANAVILKEGVLKDAGDVVTVDGTNPEVLAMFVWIPRYEYKIDGDYGKGGTSKTNPGEIEINFISSEKTTPTTGYHIPSSFKFGDNELSGFWVAKFEMSYTLGVVQISCLNENCETANNIRILPNMRSLTSPSNDSLNNLGTYYYLVRSMSKDGNIFGINSSLTNTHLIKNSEWGAITYLSQSKYGKYGNSDFSGENKEIFINNSSLKYTGRSGGGPGGSTPINATYTDQSSTSEYDKNGFYTYDGYLLSYDTNEKTATRNLNKGTGASTTGNIYGIYDMSGGANELVMGYYAWDSDNFGSNSSGTQVGFDSEIDLKYYDRYTTTNFSTACDGSICYGEALIETKNWYSDTYATISTSQPWLLRGRYGYTTSQKQTGIFYSGSSGGAGGMAAGSRMILTSQ